MMNGSVTKNPVTVPLPSNPETLHGTLSRLYDTLYSIDVLTNSIGYATFGENAEAQVDGTLSEESLERVASFALNLAGEVRGKLEFISNRLR